MVAQAYFYFTFRRTERQDLRTLLHSLLVQIVRLLAHRDKTRLDLWRIPRAFQDLYNRYVFDSAPRMEALCAAFLGVLNESRAICIVIDAPDECPLRQDRTDILQYLAEVLRNAAREVHVLVTSRREQDIEITMCRLRLPVQLTVVPI